MPRTRTLTHIFDQAMRQAVIHCLREHPEWTLGDLIALQGDHGRVAGSLTIGELSSGDAGAPRTGSNSKRSPDAKPPGRKRVSTRSARGRRSYDKAVLAMLHAAQGKLGAAQVRARVGGTPLQVRISLNRLIESGSIKYEGKARGTRYFAA